MGLGAAVLEAGGRAEVITLLAEVFAEGGFASDEGDGRWGGEVREGLGALDLRLVEIHLVVVRREGACTRWCSE